MSERIEPLVYAVPEVAVLLKVSPSTVHRWIDLGKVPVVRYGRVVRVPKWAVDEMIGRAA